MFSKFALASLAGSVIVGSTLASPTLNTVASNATRQYNLEHPPVNNNQSQHFCELVGGGQTPVPEWYWKQLHSKFATKTDIFIGKRKLRFAKFRDGNCGTCPIYPQGPQDLQIGSVDKLASGKCKSFKSLEDWNSLMFDYGSKLDQCRIDIFDHRNCVGTITHSYYADDEQTCMKIPGGGQSVFVSCGVGRDRRENIRISEVTQCSANLGYHDDDDDQPTDDDDPDDEAGGIQKIRATVHQDFMELPSNGTAFAYFKEADCGNCGGSGEIGQSIILRNNVCQSLDEGYRSFFYKVGDYIQNYSIKIFNEPNCVGQASTFDQWDVMTCQVATPENAGHSVMVTYDIADLTPSAPA